MRHSTLLAASGLVFVLGLLTNHAQAQEEEPEQEEVPALQIDLPFEVSLGEGFDCTSGGCESFSPRIRSNVSKSEMAARSQAVEARARRSNNSRFEEHLQTQTDVLLEYADELVNKGLGDSLIDVTVFLRTPSFRIERLRESRGNKQEFDTVWEELEASLAPPLKAATKALERLDAELHGHAILSNTLSVRIRADNIVAALQNGQIIGMSVIEVGESTATGRERRSGLALNPDGLNSWGWDGRDKPGSSDRVLVAVIEINGLNPNHVSLKDSSSGSRVVGQYLCVSNSCSSYTSQITSGSHANIVSSVLLGDAEDGQVPFLFDTLAQQDRSGIAPEANLLFYETISGFDQNVSAAISHATSQGADIINLSQMLTNQYCQYPTGGVTAAIAAATNAGVLIVAATGNDAQDTGIPSCNVSSYGYHPDTVAVGATNDITGLNSLGTVGLRSTSGRGESIVNLSGATQVKVRPVDLVTTGSVDSVADGAAGDTQTTDGFAGTSYAAPQVAGIAALLLNQRA